jgi:hypothetical protein
MQPLEQTNLIAWIDKSIFDNADMNGKTATPLVANLKWEKSIQSVNRNGNEHPQNALRAKEVFMD